MVEIVKRDCSNSIAECIQFHWSIGLLDAKLYFCLLNWADEHTDGLLYNTTWVGWQQIPGCRPVYVKYMRMKNVTIIGAGAIGTSLGNVLARKKSLQVRLLTIEPDVEEAINNTRHNPKYFPNIKLSSALKATMDNDILSDTDVAFLAIPSSVTVEFIRKVQPGLKPHTVIVNLAKGFSNDKQTIAESLTQLLDQPVVTMKGPTFARDLINRIPTAFTLACNEESLWPAFQELFRDTNVYLDYSTDVRGVELLSILKNIYAIVVGITDAHFDSPNLRFMLLTMALKEMREILVQFGGKEESIFRYCGFGDLTLTSLNDLSRNRTLGLLIGKGFFSNDISDNVVLEGKIATNIFCEEISRVNSLTDYSIISELYKVFNGPYDVSSFVSNILKEMES